ncbi:MAG: ATP-binding protein [Rhodospirillaceae bacterium]
MPVPSMIEDDKTRRSVERLRVLLELTSDSIWESDSALGLAMVHGKGGESRGELSGALGYRLDEIIDPRSVAEDGPRLLAALQERAPFRDCALPVQIPGGAREWLRLSGFPMFGEDGTFTGYLGTATRITEERQRLAAERRRQQLESLGQLAGGVAHEFNNLLVPIVMLSKMALPRVPEDDETLKLFLTTIHESGWKAAQIVRSVLTYARQMTPSAGPVRCGEVVNERIQLLRQVLPPSVVIETEISDTNTSILGNAGELSQIVVNLFNNATEAVEQYGTIRCSLHRVKLDGDERRVCGIESGDALRLMVEDTGPGIPAEIRDRVFEPFFTTKSVGRGTGLGLSVVEGIVKDWGGHIVLESSVGRGAIITILLPVIESSAEVAL